MLLAEPVVTVSVALPCLPEYVPVTVCVPGVSAVHFAPVQEPSGAIAKLVAGVTEPSVFPNWSAPVAVYDCEAPGLMLDCAGESTRWSSGPGWIVSCCDADTWPLIWLPRASALIVGLPAAVSV